MLAGVPALAWIVPHDGGYWWGPGILGVAMLVFYAVVFILQRRLPRMPDDVDPLRWQGAIASARRHPGSAPSHPGVRLAAARMAYDRVVVALFFTSLLAGLACGMLVRPDLSWTPPIGGLLVIAVVSWVRLPAAWAYLRAYAAADPA